MNFAEFVRFAYTSLNANKMRAGITMLGMVIGTASIILVVTIALTGRDYVLRQIQGVGSNLIYLYYEARSTVSGAKTLSDDLTLADLNAIQNVSGVTYAAGVVVDHDRLVLGGRTQQVVVLGTNPNYLRVRNLRILSGRFFDSSDERSFNKVCVLTPDLARALFNSLNIKDRYIRSLEVRFRVIGVFEEGVETFGASEISQYSIIIPLSVMQNFYGTDRLDTIYASASSGNLVPIVTRRIEQLLRTRHRPGALYRVENLAEILRAAGRIGTALTVVLFLVGTLSLIVSGIGIMNIMLFTVTERTREIGIKMAVGARRREILYQFLAESVLMATAGGTAGICLGISGPLTIRWIVNIHIPISWIAIVLAFMLSLLTGVVSGIVPASRASKLNPIEALRFE